MRWRVALHAKVLGGFHNSPAEVVHPDSIHGHARDQRILRINEPARQSEPVRGLIFRERMQNCRYARAHFLPLVQEAAANEDVSFPRLGQFFHDHRGGGSKLAPEAAQRGEALPDGIPARGNRPEVSAQDFLLLRGLFFPGSIQDSLDTHRNPDTFPRFLS